MFSSLSTFGVTGVDRLLSFMIVTELQVIMIQIVKQSLHLENLLSELFS